MSNFGTFELTHPELLSETELREILQNRCIDFSPYERLPRAELIEVFRRVAMPLPRRQGDSAEISEVERNSLDETRKNLSNGFSKHSVSSSSTHGLKRCATEDMATSQSSERRQRSPEFRVLPKRPCTSDSRNGAECNGVNKRMNDGSHDDSPTRKWQKITWP